MHGIKRVEFVGRRLRVRNLKKPGFATAKLMTEKDAAEGNKEAAGDPQMESQHAGGLIGFDEMLESIKKAIEAYYSGEKSNIAVISEPFSGRTSLLYEVAEVYKESTTLHTLSCVLKEEGFLDKLDRSKDIVLLDNCHFLYMRRIGGFEILERFLDFVVSSEKLFITTWNLFSWNYLRTIFGLESVFSTQLSPPKLSPEDLKKLILAQYDRKPVFADENMLAEDNTMRHCLQISKKNISIGFLNRSVEIPIIKAKCDLLLSTLAGKIKPKREEPEVSLEDRIFERLREASEGNPGVAKAIWEQIAEPGNIKPEGISKPQFKIDLNFDTSFVLYVILSAESITKSELEDIADTDLDMDQLLYNFARLGLISMNGELCKIKPEALHSLEGHLKAMRLVW
jgi:hypothetical protein